MHDVALERVVPRDALSVERWLGLRRLVQAVHIFGHQREGQARAYHLELDQLWSGHCVMVLAVDAMVSALTSPSSGFFSKTFR